MFNDWNALYTQLVALRTQVDDSGKFTIVMDDTDAAVALPTGAFDMDRTSWEGMPKDFITSGFTVVTLPDGCSITNLSQISMLEVDGNNTSANIELTLGQELSLYRAKLSSAGHAPLVHLSGRAAIILGDHSTIVNTGDGAVTGTISMDGGIILDLLLDGVDSSFGGNTLASSTVVAVLASDSSSSYVTTQTYLSGGISVTQLCTSWQGGGGNPNGVVTAGKGFQFVDTNSGTIYVNTDGATTWGQTVVVTP